MTCKMYRLAENAAQWCDRGDDHAEAAAVRRMVTEHAAMVAGQPIQRSPIGFLFQLPIPPKTIDDYYETKWSSPSYCPLENRAALDGMVSVKITPIYGE